MTIDGFKIKGGKQLKGRIRVSGSKNAALPIMAATLVQKGEYILHNIPALRDIGTMTKLLEELGVKSEKIGENSYKFINTGEERTFAPYDLVKTMRASFFVMGPLLTNHKKATVSLPGGCAIGARPVNYHIKGFEAMGVKIEIEHGYVKGDGANMKGANIYLDFPSVGATENIIMAAVKAEGKTVIENAAREPEITDLADFLNKMGGKISGAGTSRIEIEGVTELFPCEYTIIPDRIEAGTLIIASVLTGGQLEIENVRLEHLESFKMKLEEMGVCFAVEDQYLRAWPDIKGLKPTKITTMPYPGYPTDLQAQIMILMSMANGTSEIKETIFENRFMHVPELNRMGTKIDVDGHMAIIRGNCRFTGAEVMASDLRAGASLVLAALIAEGETTINRIYHIDRGYEKFEGRLRAVGAEIERIKQGNVNG